MTIRWLFNNLINAYVYSTIIVLIFTSIANNPNFKLENYLNKINYSILIIAFVNLLFVFSQTPFLVREYKIFPDPTEHKIWITDFCNYAYLLLTIVLGFLFQLVFLFKKNRINLTYTIISVLLLFILIHLGSIVVFGSRINYELLSATTTYFINGSNLIYIALFSFTFFIFHRYIIKI